MNELLTAARAGQPQALGRILEDCRGYLLAIADREFDSQLGAKAGASDLVQETFLEAQRDFPRFRGATQAELLGWLRKLLLNNLANFSRGFHATDKRQVGREVNLDAAKAAGLTGAANGLSPSECVIRAETADSLHRALDCLSDDHRRLIEWRYREELSFSVMAAKLGCSPKVVRRLWGEAVECLQREMEVNP
jgi:RNA polymerase sigma-70 factor (ECF subfamily)